MRFWAEGYARSRRSRVKTMRQRREIEE
jgi:hypothetical protein